LKQNAACRLRSSRAFLEEEFMENDQAKFPFRSPAACLLAASLLAPLAPALAQQNGGGADTMKAPDLTKPAGTEAANVSTVGDYFKFNVEVKGFTPSDSAGAVTAPQGSCFRVSKEFADPTNPGRQMLRGRFETGLFPRGLWPPYSCSDLSLNTSLSYDVSKQSVLEDYDRDRFGWTYGVLVAPVKYYVKPHEFSAGASVGPYLGYRVHDRQGSSNVIAISIGAATATVTTNNADGSAASTNTTGLTVAGAYLVDIKGAFNIGLLAGTDIYSKSQNVPTSNKLWLGLSFGYKLE
jgi:hypothetical protein